MITSNGTVQAVADIEAVASKNSGVATVLTQETLRQVAEAVRSAFPRPSANCELVLLDVDPRHLHAFWTVPPDQTARLRGEIPTTDDNPPLVLRITEVSPQGKPGDCFDIEVLGLQGQFYVDIWADARRYQGSIGLRQPDGSLAVLARSNVVELPRGGPSADNTWREVALPAPATPPPPRVARPHAPSFAPVPAATPIASPAVVNGAAAAPASAQQESAVSGTTPVAAGEKAIAAMPLAAAAGPTVAPEASDTAPPAVMAAPGEVDRFAPVPTGKLAPVAPVPLGMPDASPLLPDEPAGPARAADATVPGPDPEPGPAFSPPPPAPDSGELVAAIARHEAEAVAPLAPFPYYEPEATEPAPATPPVEAAPADASDEPPAAAEAIEASPGASEGPEPVPLPLENVLTLSSFAVAGGAVEFEINAELHIFGQAKPGMKLEMFGRPVPIRPDGTFSINRPLPNGALVLSVLLAKNGERKE